MPAKSNKFYVPEEFGNVYVQMGKSSISYYLDENESKSVVSIKCDATEQKRIDDKLVKYDVTEYAICDGLFISEGVSPFNPPTSIKDVYVDDATVKESVNESIYSQEKIPTNATSLFVEFNNHTENEISVFASNSFDGLKVLYNVKDKENTTDSNLENIGAYTVKDNMKEIVLPSFALVETAGEAEAFSPSTTERVYRVSPNSSIIVELPMQGDSKKTFALRVSGVSQSNKTDEFFLARVIGYRS